MAEIACCYHDELQNLDRPDHSDHDCITVKEQVLSEIPPEQLFNDPNSPLHAVMTNNQVCATLINSKNGTVTGLDSILYEVWKQLHVLHLQNMKLNKPSFDMIACLRTIYNEIQTQGTNPSLDFSAGWMSPIYKKKDKTKIENYRPITLLNTDYKLMTKVLATQLAGQAVPSSTPTRLASSHPA